jgi:3-oxoacyl-[acyl-carrier-protein] synthase III
MTYNVDGNLHLKLVGTGTYLPQKVVTNEDFRGRVMYPYDDHSNRDFERAVTQDPSKIFALTGVEERHIAGPQDIASFMGLQAAIQAIDEYGLRGEALKTFVNSIDVIFGTVSEARRVPSGGTKIVKGLSEHYGVRIEDSTGYDSGNACAGFAEAVLQANSRVVRRPKPKLVVVSEDVSGMTSQDDMNMILFGAGGGAALFVPTLEPVGVFGDVSYVNPHDGRDGLICDDFLDPRLLRMTNGGQVLKQAPKLMMGAVERIQAQLGWDRIDAIIPHQANSRITALMQRMNPSVPVLDTIRYTGNMSGVTCAYTLDRARKVGARVSGSDRILKIEPGMRYVVVGLGGSIAVAAYGYQN